MLNTESRIARYEAQNGSERLTGPQIKRARKKKNAQSPAAQSARESRTAQRVAEAARRKDRRHLPTP